MIGFTMALTVASLLMLNARAVIGDTYDYAVDRFEADGNVHGPKDGVPDLVDEFDDGVMGPVFAPIIGTSAESGGALHLRSPGGTIPIPGLTPVPFEISAVTSGSPPMLQVGSGDAVLRIVLVLSTIGANDAVNFLLSTVGNDGLYYLGVSIANFNTSLADRTKPPTTPGLSILSHEEELNYAGGSEQLVLQQAPIDATSITGPIVLELRYNDAARTITTAYSLDGGSTFATPFTALPVIAANGTAVAYIAATAYAGECPAGIQIRSAALNGLGVAGKSRISMRAFLGGERRGYEPLRLVLTDEGAGGTSLLDVNVPDTLVATPKCGPRDGWYGGSGNRYKYLNYSNALPPDCIAGSAQGLQRLQLKWNGTNDMKLKVANASLPSVTGPVRFALYKGTGPVNECDGYVGEASCAVQSGKAKCSSQ
jgi:hypothetical protein